MRVFTLSPAILLCATLSSIVLPAAAAPVVTVAPLKETVGVGQTIQFTAKVTGLASATVKWQVESVTGGNATYGTISAAGLYKAPTAAAKGIAIVALGSDGKTKGTASVDVVPIGPAITKIVPNPIFTGSYTITLVGTGFKPGAVVRNGTIDLTTTFVSATQLKATGQQATTAVGVFEVENPGSAWGPAFKAPFQSAGAPLTIAPKTVHVHLQQRQQFTSPGATSWTASAGVIDATGLYAAPYTMPKSDVVTITAAGAHGFATAIVTLVSGALQAIKPAAVTLDVGQKQQFLSSGGTGWQATYGTISSTGLYTAPAVWPSSGGDKITVTGPQGAASAVITLTPPTPIITQVGNQGQIPLGLFSVNVQGKNFSAGSSASIYGGHVSTSLNGNDLRITGFFTKPGPAMLIVSNRNAVSKPFPIQVGVPSPKVSAAAARRFLQQAAFGPSPNDIETVQTVGFAYWISSQVHTPQVSTYKKITGMQGGMPEQFLTNAVDNPDQLRQRVAFALSQIFVTSLAKLGNNENMIGYQDMLLADAFVNYRKILSDVTLSPAMGQYLDMANNAKADSAAGSVANENYARELMQLFTIGTQQLNLDGTVKYDSNQLPIPTYSQFTVTEYARVYTGWTYAPKPAQPIRWNAAPSGYGNLVTYPAEHDFGSKQLLNGQVSPAGVSAGIDMSNALSSIFNHPNVGPFVSTQLIQHLVKSNPSPAYVERVATVFNNNGNGVRGDMQAVVAAILLDPEARANDDGENDEASDGHLQEPALFIAGMVRAFAGQMYDTNYYQYDLADMGENLFASPSVFNYFAPNYAVPGTTLLGGEFQIYSPNNAILRANEVSNLFRQYSDPVQSYGPGTIVDLSAFLPLAPDPARLVDALDLTLTRGVMPAAMKAAIVEAVTGETGGNLRRVQRGCYLILTSSYYNVWH